MLTTTLFPKQPKNVSTTKGGDVAPHCPPRSAAVSLRMASVLQIMEAYTQLERAKAARDLLARVPIWQQASVCTRSLLFTDTL